jgi:hypothetical protein
MAERDAGAEPEREPEEAQPRDEDTAWESIVASYDEPTAPVGHWPASEDLDTAWQPPPAPEPLEPELEDDEAEPVEWDEGHYVPPPPPPIPIAHPLTLWAWVALLAGVLILLGAPLLSYELSGGWTLTAILLVVGGFAALVARMRDSPPTDSGPDDGAVV